MKIKIITVAAAAAMSVAMFATSASADMASEATMLTGTLYKTLKAEGLPTDNIDKLTLSEILQLKLILEDDEMGGSRAQAMKILDKK